MTGQRPLLKPSTVAKRSEGRVGNPRHYCEPSVELRADKENFALLAPRALVRHVTAPPIETRAHQTHRYFMPGSRIHPGARPELAVGQS
jgi:hypothetical protein